MRVIAAAVIILLMAGLTLFSAHTIHVMRAERLADEQKAATAVPSQLDFYLEQASLLQYDRQGLLTRKITAPLIKHYEEGDRFHMVRPTFTFFVPQEQPWVVTALQAKSRQGRQVVDLQQQVRITRERGPASSRVQVETEQLQVDVDQRRATTQQAVSFLEDANLMQGVGATIDFKQGLIKLASKIRIWYKLGL